MATKTENPIMIRYEITTVKAGCHIDSEFIKRVTSSKALSKPKVVVWIDNVDRHVFETSLEINKSVIAFSVDYRQPGKPDKEWERS